MVIFKDMPLSLRTYDCPKCGISIDRDLNASIKSEKCGRFDRKFLWMSNRRWSHLFA
ncbi:MAG: hypothetical protein F6K15_15855 [Okeania sp. SIO2B3]|nr:hypothetical protein [Okeania sp. SIO2B3]